MVLGLSFSLAPGVAAADKPGSPPGKADAKHDEAAEHRRGKPPGDPGKGPKADEADKGAKREAGDKDAKHGDDKGELGKGPEGRGDFKRAWRELHDELKSGKLKKDEIKEKLAKLQETSETRAKDHRRALSERWGYALASPAVREELKQHARRVAFLNRAMVLAESEPKDKAKRTERITKLLDKENERHERAMERFKSTPAPALSASAAPPPAPATSAEAAKGGTP